MLDVSTIRPYGKNPRINGKAVSQVAKSIEQYGFQQPIVVDKKNVVIVGHTRLLAAKELNLKKVPVVIADSLTPKQVKAYRIADNKTHEFADWDFDLLKLELESLGDLENIYTGFDLSSLKDAETPDYSDSEFEKFSIRIDCTNELEQEKLYKEFSDRGLKCQVLSL